MNRPTLTLLFCAALINKAQAQQTIGSAGGQFTGPDLVIDYNIGEAVIGTVGDPNTILTQGFEQPWVEISTLTPDEDDTSSLLVYPNPVRHFLNIEQVGDPGVHDYHLLDARGRSVMNGKLQTTRTELDTRDLASGTYLLHLMNANKQHERSFRIIITH